MPIETGAFIDDAVQNLVALINANRATWDIKDVKPYRGSMPSAFPSIEVNSTGASPLERIESGGGYMCYIGLDVWYWFAQFSEEFAKRELDQHASYIAVFLAEHPTVDGYANDLVVDSITITALPEQRTGTPVAFALITCTLLKEIFLTYQD